jgi:hypothetical protein
MESFVVYNGIKLKGGQASVGEDEEEQEENSCGRLSASSVAGLGQEGDGRTAQRGVMVD